ncbi:MAG TPA: trypsin-like peptidase domain-containing protein [Baekduia sp.]|uniref:S1C family serine protease n=1 Tax=Baekduia sp. TaxID=2600305 RepID=UPI002CBF163F|nr:trypsin-like peptidase domain-containing protein [Baekduia sp.]HMJ33822.1 trypsin-like peptidase domain-containing protein [Baekduia sp.]
MRATTAARAAAGLATAMAFALPAAGCGRDSSGGDGSGGGARGTSTAQTRTQTETVQRTTRVEVVRQAGADTGFDPQGIYRRESPGVVTLLAIDPGTGSSARGGLGSGFVVDASGEIATNAHVVTSGTGRSIKPAREVFVRFGDGNQVAGRIVGFDPFSDVALVKVDPRGLTLRPLPLGSIAAVHVGEPVAAIGSPFGEERSLSVGVISATGRSIESLTGFQTSGALQTDAAINSGNSGGPLLDARGRVLGINSQIRTTSGEGSGVGFAVPVDVVRRSLDQLRATGHVRYAFLGVSTQGVYPQLAERFHLGTERGAWIQAVVPGGPAAGAGLKAGTDRQRFQETPWRVGGDIVTTVEGEPIRQDADLALAVQDHAPGETVTLGLIRDGKPRTIEVRLGTRPLQSPRG